MFPGELASLIKSPITIGLVGQTTRDVLLTYLKEVNDSFERGLAANRQSERRLKKKNV